MHLVAALTGNDSLQQGFFVWNDDVRAVTAPAVRTVNPLQVRKPSDLPHIG